MLQSRWRTWLIQFLIAQALACSSSSLANRHAQIGVAPAALDFGSVDGLAAISKVLTVTNSGTGTLNVRGAEITEDPAHVFTLQGVPTRLDLGASAVLTVVMTPPVESGLYGASLIISSDADNAPQILVQLSVRVGRSSAPDGGIPDAGSVDAGSVDAGTLDAGPADAGAPDAGASDAGNGCPSGQMLCSGRCTDTLSDPNHCGLCETRCGSPGFGCSAGSCVACAPAQGYVTLAAHQGQPWALAVDSTSVYWTAQTDTTVMKVGINGGSPVALATAAQFPWPASLQPTSIASDATNVYFANNTMQTVLKIARNGGTAVSLGGSGAWPSKLAVNASGVFWVVSTTGQVWKAPLTGGTSVTLVAAPSPDEQSELLGADATDVYWLGKGTPGDGNGTIHKVSVNGGTPTTVISGLVWPRDGAVDGTHVYWTDSVNGTVMKVPKSGGTPVTLATGLAGPRNLVVDQAYAYWSAGGTDGDLMSCDGTVQKVGLNGGPVTNVVHGQYSAWGVAVDETSVYWTDLYYGTVMKTPK